MSPWSNSRSRSSSTEEGSARSTSLEVAITSFSDAQLDVQRAGHGRVAPQEETPGSLAVGEHDQGARGRAQSVIGQRQPSVLALLLRNRVHPGQGVEHVENAVDGARGGPRLDGFNQEPALGVSRTPRKNPPAPSKAA